MTIDQLYREKMGGELARDFSDLPVDSVCGRDCEKLILAGAVMLEAANNTYPNDEVQPYIDSIRKMVVDGCEVYYFG